MRKAMFVRCYIKRTEGVWVAMCIDLCLAAQADSFTEAKTKLNEQVCSYIVSALTVDRAHARELLGRKAPLRYWFEYHWIKLASRVLGKRVQQRETAFQELPNLPLQSPCAA